VSLPYYKRFPRDFLEGTIGLSFEVKGAYAIVLDLIYMRDGRLPDDARYIAGQLGCSVRKWRAIREELVQAGKLTVFDGIISNFRADYLLEEHRKYQDKQREIASKPRKNNGLSQPEPSQPEPQPESEPEKNGGGGGVRASENETKDDWPEGKAQDHARLIVSEVTSPWLDPMKSPGLVTTAGRLAAWKRDGASWEHDVIPVVASVCAKQRGPVSTWKFFDQAIARSMADNREALQIPEAGEARRATGPPFSLTDRIAAEHAESRRMALEMLAGENGPTN
jgi:uncharacterized protein YdaU (DUF1376 family)